MSGLRLGGSGDRIRDAEDHLSPVPHVRARLADKAAVSRRVLDVDRVSNHAPEVGAAAALIASSSAFCSGSSFRISSSVRFLKSNDCRVWNVHAAAP